MWETRFSIIVRKVVTLLCLLLRVRIFQLKFHYKFVWGIITDLERVFFFLNKNKVRHCITAAIIL
jgi:hypothetical protein